MSSEPATERSAQEHLRTGKLHTLMTMGVVYHISNHRLIQGYLPFYE